MHENKSLKLREQLAEAVSKLHGKDAGLAEQLAFQLEKMQRQHAAALKQLFGHKSERSERAVCDLCSAQMKPWKDQFEKPSEVDFIVPKVILLKHYWQKYRCTCGGCIKTAQGPTRLFPKARYSVGFSINVAVQKYCCQMPLDRQTPQLRRLGVDITSTTLWDNLSAMYNLLERLGERLAAHVLDQPVISVDETTWKLLKIKKMGKSKTWWLWLRRADSAAHYTLDEGRSTEVALRLLSS